MALLFSLVVGCKSQTPNNGRIAAPNWTKLGERLVDFRADHDVLPVTAHKGAFTALKLKVLRAPIFINRVTVHYGNGSSQAIPVNRRFAAGSESKVLNLPGNKRIIKKITFRYKTGPKAIKKSMVVVLGRH